MIKSFVREIKWRRLILRGFRWIVSFMSKSEVEKELKAKSELDRVFYEDE